MRPPSCPSRYCPHALLFCAPALHPLLSQAASLRSWRRRRRRRARPAWRCSRVWSPPTSRAWWSCSRRRQASAVVLKPAAKIGPLNNMPALATVCDWPLTPPSHPAAAGPGGGHDGGRCERRPRPAQGRHWGGHGLGHSGGEARVGHGAPVAGNCGWGWGEGGKPENAHASP